LFDSANPAIFGPSDSSDGGMEVLIEKLAIYERTSRLHQNAYNDKSNLHRIALADVHELYKNKVHLAVLKKKRGDKRTCDSKVELFEV